MHVQCISTSSVFRVPLDLVEFSRISSVERFSLPVCNRIVSIYQRFAPATCQSLQFM